MPRAQSRGDGPPEEINMKNGFSPFHVSRRSAHWGKSIRGE
jgi:hypothetical protein